MNSQFDELDRKLLACLQTNARESTSNLARHLDVARSTVHERLSRLERNGTIAGYSVVLGPKAGERKAQALVLLSVQQQQSRKVVRELETYPEIKLCMTVGGQYDMFLTVETDHLEELDDLLDDIAEVPGVERSRSVIVLSRKFDRRQSTSRRPEDSSNTL
ncbi:MAG: Lrp/AsnC family transcriptional regulator [Stappiaceae bacterium]